MHDLIVVGAGPAGMAGAVAAADEGLRVLVVDEQARAGGQIFRRPPAEFDVRKDNFAPYPWAGELIERFEYHPGIETLFRSSVFGVLRDRHETTESDSARPVDADHLQIAVHTPRGGELHEAPHLLIATGAYDMSVPFPGWTKPGVMMAGAVQSLLKSQKVLAGRKIVLAGSHPLLLVVAEQMLAAGAHISEIAFARGLPGAGELASALPAVPGHLGVFGEAAKALSRIARHRVRISTHTVVVEAGGSGTVSNVVLAKIDRRWRVIGPPRQLPADLLVLGYGFTPSTDLARQAGCEMRWDSAKGGWIVAHDELFRTTAPGVWVAGEPTGVAGAEQSAAEGRIAGLRIAETQGGRGSRSTGAPSGTTDEAGTAAAVEFGAQLAKAEKQLRTANRFSRVVQSMFEPQREALSRLSRTADTYLCRCELVTSEQVEEALETNPFISSVNALKLECRTGMGPCQGRYCEGAIMARVAECRGMPVEATGYFNAHLPVKPVPLDVYRSLGTTAEPQGER